MSVSINTKSMQKSCANLSLNSDLDSVTSFRGWVENNILIYRDINSEPPPDEHLLIYLNHIEELVLRNDISEDIDRSDWVKKISKRIADLKIIMNKTLAIIFSYI